MIFLVLIVAINVTEFAINLIRPGEAMAGQIRLSNDFVVGILPPPLVLIEPMLHATLIASDPEEVAAQEMIVADLEAPTRIGSHSGRDPTFHLRSDSAWMNGWFR